MAPKSSDKPRPENEKRTVMLTVRLKPSEHERIRVAADAVGLSVGVWIRHMSLKALEAAKGES